MIRARVFCYLTFFLTLQVFTACQTVADNSSESASEPSAYPISGDGPQFNLGQLRNNDVRSVVYQTLKQTFEKTESLGNGDSTSLELGDIADFQYEVIKLVNGEIDVSGASNPTVDAIDVEVRGWLKRISRYGDGKPTEDRCFGFESRVKLKFANDEWTAAAGQTPVLSREDPEDCY